MKLPAIVIFVVLFSQTLAAQKPGMIAVIDTVITVMKTNSVNRTTVNWDALRNKALQLAKDAQNSYQLGPAFRMLMQETNDFHGSIFVGDSTFRWQRPEPPVPDSISNAWKKGVVLQSKLLNSNIGYIRVPFMSFGKKADLDQKAQRMNDSLCALLNKNVKGMVVDLRLNGGGAIHPMMLGLQQLFGDGVLGSFTSEPPEQWIIKNNGFYVDTALFTSVNPACNTPAKTIPVAVLIGRGTGSSGEFLAMAFKGRSNTMFIGNNTAGYITSTQGFPINDSLFLLLSTTYGKDSKGRVYKEALKPDMVSNEPDSFNDIEHDKKVLAAVKWIESR